MAKLTAVAGSQTEGHQVTTTVVNLRREAFDVYIGRAGKGKDGTFGNPYRVSRWVDVEQALVSFRLYFLNRIDTDPEFKKRVLELRGKRLGCFCAPGLCHGDVISEWVNSQ